KEKPNPNITTLPFSTTFDCKNISSIQLLGIGLKPKGFATKHVLTRFYNQLIIECTHRHVTAYVLNNSGIRLAEATTKKFEIAKHLYRTYDINAATNIGRVLADRCYLAGVHRVIWDWKKNRNRLGKKKFLAVFAGIQESNKIILNEPEEIKNYPLAVNNYLEKYRPIGYKSLMIWVTKLIDKTVKVYRE
ncbi:39S ribosomal protein L18, mitochondrial-like, partial [Oopsacas minuta]